MISIVTPTYNRAYSLPRLYKSLLKNKKTHSDFEWVIIDDGSTDNTKELIDKWIDEGKVIIRYYKQKNSGKMAALNFVMKNTKGNIIVELDSDDYLKDKALKIIANSFEEIENDPKLYGVLFRKEFNNKAIDEKNVFPFDREVSKMFDLYMKKGFDKDAAVVFKGDIRRKFKHKLERNEKFITEARMYNEMDKLYDGLLCINEPIMVCEYLQDGYSKNINNVFKNNPYGYRCYFKESLEMDLTNLPFKKRLYFVKHYILFSYLTSTTKYKCIKEVYGFFNKILTTILVIPGYYKSKKRFF
ncbi:MAG: glycosyltransferase family 2 protein [Bacilli bacterium]|nr:glycosyltransferase family 2 protein [Bacilli bacterium]